MEIFFASDKTCQLINRNFPETKEEFIIEAPNEGSKFEIEIKNLDSGMYVNSLAELKSSYSEYSIVLKFNYSSHLMQLEKLITTDEIEIPFSFNLRDEITRKFVLLNPEVVFNFFADLAIQGVSEKYYNGDLSLEFETVDIFTRNEIEGFLWYSQPDGNILEVYSENYQNQEDSFIEKPQILEINSEIFEGSIDSFEDSDILELNNWQSSVWDNTNGWTGVSGGIIETTNEDAISNGRSAKLTFTGFGEFVELPKFPNAHPIPLIQSRYEFSGYIKFLSGNVDARVRLLMWKDDGNIAAASLFIDPVFEWTKFSVTRLNNVDGGDNRTSISVDFLSQGDQQYLIDDLKLISVPV